jgi:hypothetical protein
MGRDLAGSAVRDGIHPDALRFHLELFHPNLHAIAMRGIEDFLAGRPADPSPAA